MSLPKRHARPTATRVRTLLMALGTTVATTAGCGEDAPRFSDYDRLSERAEECGPVRVTVRGTVDEVIAPGLFRVTDSALFANGIWVLSHSRVRVEPEQYVVGHGTLRPGPPEVLESRYGVTLDPPLRHQVAREGLFVAESMAAFPAGPPG